MKEVVVDLGSSAITEVVSNQTSVVVDVDVPSVVVGVPGPAGPPGPSGGSVLSGWWVYSDQTSAPPAAGQVRVGSEPGGVGMTGLLYLHKEDNDGLDWSSFTATGAESIMLRSSTGEFWNFSLDAVTDNTTYWALDVTLLASTGSPPKKGRRVQVSVSLPGAQGPKGDPGQDGKTYLILNVGDPIPPGTPADTLIVRI